MARNRFGGMAHLTVVPENFEPDRSENEQNRRTGESDDAADEG
jgi:hypothetical protein